MRLRFLEGDFTDEVLYAFLFEELWEVCCLSAFCSA